MNKAAADFNFSHCLTKMTRLEVPNLVLEKQLQNASSQMPFPTINSLLGIGFQGLATASLLVVPALLGSKEERPDHLLDFHASSERLGKRRRGEGGGGGVMMCRRRQRRW